MSRKRILSTILFDTQDNEQDLSENDMMNMMGGTISQSVFSNVGGAAVKSVFSSVGINIDNLPFIGSSSDANSSKKAVLSIFSFDEIPSHEIRFRGQRHIDEKELQDAMGVDTKSIFAFWKEDKPTIKDKLLPTLEESLRNFYDSKGFYDATFMIERSKTNVIISIEENEPVKISDIDISSDHDISKLVTFKKGQIFRSKDFVSIKRNITEGLLKEGYCNYDLDSKAYVDLNRHEVSVRFKLKKNDVCNFGKTSVKGLETIDDSVVLSRVRAREGERFNMDRIEETNEALYDLDAFDFVSVKHDRKFYNVVPIDVEATEVKRPWYFKGDIEFDTTVGLRAKAELIRTNFMGNAKNIRLGLTYSKIDKVAELSYFVPALFNISDYYIDLTSKLGYSDFKYEGFNEEKIYAETFLTYNDEKWGRDTGVAIEDIDILVRKSTAPEIIEWKSTLYPQ
jgi:translocation and assembly module TamA